MPSAQVRRVTDLTGETSHKNPIFGVGTRALVSLAAAIAFAVTANVIDASAAGTIEYLAYDFADEKLEEGPDPYGLTRDEIGAIHVYTQDSPWYQALNQLLRSEDRAMLQAFFPYLKLLLTALYKLPCKEVTVFRGVKLGLTALGIYATRKKVIWWGFSSATTSLGVLNSALFLGSSGVRTLFSVKLRYGYDISSYSAIRAEDEVLILPGTVLAVRDHYDAGGDLTMIQLEEVEAPPLLDFPRPTDEPPEIRAGKLALGTALGTPDVRPAPAGFAVAPSRPPAPTVLSKYKNFPLTEYEGGSLWTVNVHFPGLQAVSKDPWLFVIHDLLTPGEIDALHAKVNSPGAKFEDEGSDSRKVHRMICRIGPNEIPSLHAKFARLMNMPAKNLEPLRYIKYTQSGGSFSDHTDQAWGRAVSLFVYLDDYDADSGTRFLNINKEEGGLVIQPRKGMGVLQTMGKKHPTNTDSVSRDEQVFEFPEINPDLRYDHEGMPTSGEKLILAQMGWWTSLPDWISEKGTIYWGKTQDRCSDTTL